MRGVPGVGVGRGEPEEPGMLSSDRWPPAQPTPPGGEAQRQKPKGLGAAGGGVGWGDRGMVNGVSWVYNLSLQSLVLPCFSGSVGGLQLVGKGEVWTPANPSLCLP